MKMKIILASCLLVLFSFVVNGQTEEEKISQEEKMEKMLDSLMNEAGMEGFIDQLKEMGEEQKRKKKKR
ncbi:hypothetical protein [Maribacter halichondriae]|uniref:hypothetical protein n=1 Tax=Maribacter halichondriae TaxID=2980554 RepID=UPI002359BA82|nr:hypothetical protein [Maribacter sp. Hal144]